MAAARASSDSRAASASTARRWKSHSGAKMIVGAIAFGYYASCFASLELEKDLIQEHIARGTSTIGSGRTLAIAKRFRDFSLYSITISSASRPFVAVSI